MSIIILNIQPFITLWDRVELRTLLVSHLWYFYVPERSTELLGTNKYFDVALGLLSFVKLELRYHSEIDKKLSPKEF